MGATPEEKKKRLHEDFDISMKEKMSLAQMMIEEKEPVDKISKYTGYAIDKLKEIASAMGQTLV